MILVEEALHVAMQVPFFKKRSMFEPQASLQAFKKRVPAER